MSSLRRVAGPPAEAIIFGLSLWGSLLAVGCILLVIWDLVAVVGAALRIRLPKPPPAEENGPPVVVIVPCKGDSEPAREFFRRLMAQRYRPFRVILVVESERDSACNLMQLPGMAERTELVIAGLAQNSSQKVANVIAALDRVRPEDAILVQADADHRPPPEWIGQLVQPLLAKTADVVTGYRLQIPGTPALGSCLAAAMDAAVTTSVRPKAPVLCWGGCTAAWRETWERVRFRQELVGSFNDDMLASRLFEQASLRIAMPRHMILPMAANYSLEGLVNFAPRQYLQVRKYARPAAVLSFVALPAPLLGWEAAIIAAVTGYSWGWAAVAAGFVAATAKAFLRQSLVRQLAGAEGVARWRCAFWVTCLAAPLLSLIHWALGYFGLFGPSTVVWAGTRYRIHGPKDVKVLERLPDATS